MSEFAGIFFCVSEGRLLPATKGGIGPGQVWKNGTGVAVSLDWAVNAEIEMQTGVRSKQRELEKWNID